MQFRSVARSRALASGAPVAPMRTRRAQHRCARRSVAALFVALFFAPAAHSQDAPARILVEGASAARIFAIAADLESAGRADEARTLYQALAKDPDPEIRAEARFRHALLLDRLGKKREAAVQLRALLDEKPDAARVRIELARLLTEIGDESAARRELRQAQAAGLPPQVAQAVDQFANALRSRKPIGASLELALVPDSNINRATDSETLDTIIAPLELSRDAREQSGIGVRAAGQAFVRVPLGDRLSLLPRISAQGEIYRQHRFDDVSGSALIGLEWSPGRERIRPSAGATFRWYGGELYARTATFSLSWQHPLDRRTLLDTTLTVAPTDYLQNDLQDGMLLNASLSAEHAFTPRSGGSVSLSATRQTAEDPGYATAAGGINLLYWRELGRTSAFVTAGLRRLEGDERLFLFPDRRREWTYSLGAGATVRALQYRGFAPVVRVEWERNRSTVGIYDYRRLAATVGITRAF
jgi:outer membrane protein